MIKELPFLLHYEAGRMGRSCAWVECPFCGTETKAYLWSWAGNGYLRCGNCKAKHLYVKQVSRLQPGE